MIRSFTVAALVACSVALAGSANAAVYASELKLVSADSATGQYTFSFVLNTESLFTRLIVKDSGNAEVAKVEMGAMTKGTKTFIWNGKTSGGASVPAGTYSWAVEAEDAGVTAPTQISDNNALTSMYYSPRGMAVDNNITSPFYGRVYALEQAAGGAVSGTPTRTTTKGVYIMNAAMEDCTGQGATGYLGGITWPATSGPYRPFVGEDGMVYLSDWSDTNGGVYTMDPANPSAAFKSLFDTSLARDAKGMRWTSDNKQVGGSVPGLYVQGSGANRVLYTFDEDYVPEGYTTGTILQYNVGTNTVISTPPDAVLYNSLTYLWANGTCSVVPDLNNTGFWISQNRAGDAGNTVGVPGLVHVGLDKAVNYNSGGTNFPAGGPNGGMVAYSADKTLVAISSAGGIKIYSYDKTKTDASAFTFRWSTPLVASNTGGYCYGLSFDGAGNVYGISNQSERLKIFALPKEDNKVVTPALDTQKFTITPPASVDAWTKF